jgi:ABC-type sugar transport system substrate-binding protein
VFTIKKKVLAIGLALPLVLAASTSSGDDDSGSTSTAAAGGGQGSYGYNFAVVTHGAIGDSFWDVVKKGVEQAGKDEGVKVTYQSDGDPHLRSLRHLRDRHVPPGAARLGGDRWIGVDDDHIGPVAGLGPD